MLMYRAQTIFAGNVENTTLARTFLDFATGVLVVSLPTYFFFSCPKIIEERQRCKSYTQPEGFLQLMLNSLVICFSSFFLKLIATILAFSRFVAFATLSSQTAKCVYQGKYRLDPLHKLTYIAVTSHSSPSSQVCTGLQ